MTHHRLPIIAPSILSADFSRLADEIAFVEQSGVEWLHLDVMDGHFVPNLTFGPQIVAAMRKHTRLYLDVHLMIYNPMDWIERFAESGADQITIHYESTEDVEETLLFIQRCGLHGGVAFCPETPASMILPLLPLCDMVLLMTVSPGFGGQPFMEEVLDKIDIVRQEAERLQLRRRMSPQQLAKGHAIPAEGAEQPFFIQVDGGINPETGGQAAAVGANIFVAGHSLFHGERAGFSSRVHALQKGVLSGASEARWLE